MTGKLIGFGGFMTAGKDVAADHLVEAHGWTKLGMSDALHEAMLALDPIVDVAGGKPYTYSSLIHRYGYVETKAQFPEARRLLQKLGTEIGRDMFDPNVWTDIARRKIVARLMAGEDVVITGLRFENELQMVKGLGRAIWVHRPGVGPVAGAHASETGLDREDFDEVLMNDGTLTDLREKTDRFAT